MRNILEQFEINVQTFEWKLQGWAGGTNNTINYVSEVIKTFDKRSVPKNCPTENNIDEIIPVSKLSFNFKRLFVQC